MIITALIGNPTSHSCSPTLFTNYASSVGLEYAHLKIDVPPKKLKTYLNALQTLGFSGLNITLPYKQAVIKYLNYVDPIAKAIGAVNTVVITKNKFRGYNTDSFGAISSIKSQSKNIKGCRALVLGTGGASRAIVYGLLEEGCSVIVAFRKPLSLRTSTLFHDFKNKVIFIENTDDNLETAITESDLICNATSCGMSPFINDSPVSIRVLNRASKKSDFSKKLFFDAIFNPYKTKFLSYAEKLNAKIQGGTEMMIYQGIKAFHLWTGYSVDQKIIRESAQLLKEKLTKSLS